MKNRFFYLPYNERKLMRCGLSACTVTHSWNSISLKSWNDVDLTDEFFHQLCKQLKLCTTKDRGTLRWIYHQLQFISLHGEESYQKFKVSLQQLDRIKKFKECKNDIPASRIELETSC